MFDCFSLPGSFRQGSPGYLAVINEHGQTEYAHRYAYRWSHGAVPHGLEIHHICQNPACANPEHLQAVTHRRNMLATPSNAAAQHASRTHCPRGHELVASNLLARKNGSRECKTCHRDRMRRTRQAV